MSLIPLSMVLLVFPRQDEIQMLWIVSLSNTEKYIHIQTHGQIDTHRPKPNK